MEAGEHDSPGGDTLHRPRARVGHVHLGIGVTHVEAGRIEADAHGCAVAVELAVVERRQHHVIHAGAGRDVGHKSAHQQAGKRGVAVGEVIDVGLALRGLGRGRQAERIEPGIAEIARIGGRHRVAAEPEEPERAALEAIGGFLAQTAVAHQIVAIARALEQRELLRDRAAGERIARTLMEREELRPARRRDRKVGDESGKRARIGKAARGRIGAAPRRLAGDQRVAAERLASKEHAARQPV